MRRGKIRFEKSVGLSAAEAAADTSNREEGRAIKRDRFGGNEREACLIGR